MRHENLSFERFEQAASDKYANAMLLHTARVSSRDDDGLDPGLQSDLCLQRTVRPCTGLG